MFWYITLSTWKYFDNTLPILRNFEKIFFCQKTYWLHSSFLCSNSFLKAFWELAKCHQSISRGQCDASILQTLNGNHFYQLTSNFIYFKIHKIQIMKNIFIKLALMPLLCAITLWKCWLWLICIGRDDSDTDSETDSKSNGYIVLCRTFRIAQIWTTPYFCIGQESQSESAPISQSGNVVKPPWLVYTARFRLGFRLQIQWPHCTVQKFSHCTESDSDSNPNC